MVRYGQIMVTQANKDQNLLLNINALAIGIQGPVGTEFSINNKTNIIKIGETGIYELDVKGYGYITSLYIHNISISQVPIYIDYKYEEATI